MTVAASDDPTLASSDDFNGRNKEPRLFQRGARRETASHCARAFLRYETGLVHRRDIGGRQGRAHASARRARVRSALRADPRIQPRHSLATPLGALRAHRGRAVGRKVEWSASAGDVEEGRITDHLAPDVRTPKPLDLTDVSSCPKILDLCAAGNVGKGSIPPLAPDAINDRGPPLEIKIRSHPPKGCAPAHDPRSEASSPAGDLRGST